LVVGFALFALTIATLTTNVAANVVSPANDFSNLWPRVISFKRGAIITGVLGILIFPWKLYTDLANYIFAWLIGYGALLGAIGGVMIADYYLIRRCALEPPELYHPAGRYSYGGSGFNWRALLALATGIIPNVPGFLAQASRGTIGVPQFFRELYVYAWFVGFLLAGMVHIGLSLIFPATSQKPAAGKVEQVTSVKA
jgi:NCS1 family nucleobase:cation symporter-1